MKFIKGLIISALFTATLSSCHAIYDYEGDCSSTYRVKLIDDVNLKFADAFDAEVQSMSLYVFDEAGDLVWYTAQGEDIKQQKDATGTHYVDLCSLNPGKYTVVAWGGAHDDSEYSLPQLTSRASRLDDLTCTLKRHYQEAYDYDLVDGDINDLFNGSAEIVIPETNDPGVHSFDIHLTKDTHKVSVVLQQLNGEPIDPADYEFYVEAGNGHLNYDNSILYDEKRFLYRAFEKSSSRAAVYGDDDAVITNVSAVVARHSISRLEINDWDYYSRPTLSVYNSQSGEKILSIPLIDYVLMVKNNYTQVTSDQDYLDRQDEFNFVFFINDGKWLSSSIYINSWRIVLNNNDL